MSPDHSSVRARRAMAVVSVIAGSGVAWFVLFGPLPDPARTLLITVIVAAACTAAVDVGGLWVVRRYQRRSRR